jgi:hypothetical protein
MSLCNVIADSRGLSTITYKLVSSRKFKFILDRKTIEKIYLTFIRPILEYADVVWDNKTLFLINKLENVQIEAARIVTGGTRLVSINSLYKETGWKITTTTKNRMVFIPESEVLFVCSAIVCKAFQRVPTKYFLQNLKSKYYFM